MPTVTVNRAPGCNIVTRVDRKWHPPYGRLEPDVPFGGHHRWGIWETERRVLTSKRMNPLRGADAMNL